MSTLKNKFSNRLRLKFYGSDVNENLEKLSSVEKSDFEKHALQTYEKGIHYIEKWFNFENSLFENFSTLNLVQDLNFNKLVRIVNHFNLTVNKSELFDECAIFNNVISNLGTRDKNLDNDKFWAQMLKSDKFPNLSIIVNVVLCIPVSNAFVERIFSIMNNLWSDERNSLSVNSVKAEICTKVNFSMSCNEFTEYVIKNKSIVEAAKSSKKYNYLKAIKNKM